MASKLRHKIKVVALVIGVSMTSLYSQGNINIGSEAPKIHIDKWLLNKPKKKSTKNKFIVLDFWATWCRPCLENVPHINDLQRRFEDENIMFLQMTRESSSTAKKVFDNVNFETPVVTDKQSQTHINFGDGLKDIAYYPMVVLIDDKNIIRWFGSSEKLTEDMVEDLLSRKNIDVSQMNFDGPHDIARGNEYYLKSEFGRKMWSDMWQDPDVLFAAYLQETTEDKEDKAFDVVMSTGAILESKRPSQLLKYIYPDKQFVFPRDIESKKYDFFFVNKNLNSESDELLINDVADQLGLKASKAMTNGIQLELQLIDQSLLIPSKEKHKRVKVDEQGWLNLRKNTLSDLASSLTKNTDYYWTIKSNATNRFVFKIDTSSYESILSSLKCYGIKVKEIERSIESYVFTRE